MKFFKLLLHISTKKLQKCFKHLCISITEMHGIDFEKKIAQFQIKSERDSCLGDNQSRMQKPKTYLL